MQGVVVFAWVCFAAAVVAAGRAIDEGSPLPVGAALTSVLGGVRLLAVDRALIRLTEIRDALCGSEWVRVARGGQRISLILGSRPIDDQSQNRTVAARAMAERKTFGHLS